MFLGTGVNDEIPQDGFYLAGAIRQHHNDAGCGGDGKNRRPVSAGGALRAGDGAQMVGGSLQLLIIRRKTK